MHSSLSPAVPSIGGATALYLVVADPVAQLKAPAAFNRVFASCGIDAVAVPAQVRAPHLAGFVREAMAVGNVAGLLVSIPHKTALVALMDRLDPAAAAAGAVNAVRRGHNGQLEGALFDGTGFVGALRYHCVPTQGRRALLVGAGGAGLAIACALVDPQHGLGLHTLAVHDIQPARAAALVERATTFVNSVERKDLSATTTSGGPVSCRLELAPTAAPEGYDLIIQATPLGLHAHDPLPLPVQAIEPQAVVMDILMTAADSPLVAACRARGISAHMGHQMLAQQMPAYLRYFGHAKAADTLTPFEP